MLRGNMLLLMPVKQDVNALLKITFFMHQLQESSTGTPKKC
jgi:hypothetical protein